jgi:hypothetical protein
LGEITKIRTDHIRALEDGQFDIFSAPVYIKGFVRTCATVLKMDVPAVMGRLDAELKGSERFAEPPPLSNEPKGFLDFVMLQLSKLDCEKHRGPGRGRRWPDHSAGSPDCPPLSQCRPSD